MKMQFLSFALAYAVCGMGFFAYSDTQKTVKQPKTATVTRKTSIAKKASVAKKTSAAKKPVVEVDAGPKYVPVKWCSLGTSITWYNSHAGATFQKGYQTRTMERYKFADFVNKGISGGCVSSAIGQVEPADFYTVEHGVNDWGNRVNPGTIDDYVNDTGNGTFAASYRKVINAIRAANPQAKIVICTPRKGYGFGTYLPDHCDKQQPNGYYLKDYVDVVRAIAKKEKFPLADFYTTCGEQEELAGLSIDIALHPNDAGYQRMADELVKAIAKVYPKAVPISQFKPTFTDDGKPKTVKVEKFLSSTEQVVLKGTNLAKVKVASAKIGGSWVPGGPFEGKPYFAKYDPSTKTYTCQIQNCSPQDNCMRIIALELKQEFTGDIVARVLWNRYKFNCNEYGVDYSVDGATSGACASAANYESQGYVIGEIDFNINK